MTYEKKYFNIPLNFLRFIKEDGIFDKIISWGIVDFSKRQEIDVGNLAKQIMYWYYRKPNKIPESISDGIYEMIENDIIEVDQDYDGFYETEFDPFLIEPQQKDSVIDYINENELFKITCIEFYRIEQAVSLFGISPSNKIKDDYNKLNGILCEYEELYGKDTKAGIDIDLLFDARDGKIDKNVFRLFVACRSLTGKKSPIKHTCHAEVIQRMFGYKNNEPFERYLEKNKDAYEEYKYLNKRYPINKLYKNLINRGLVSKISPPGRGYYIATKLSFEQLVNGVKKIIVKKELKKRTGWNELNNFTKEIRRKINDGEDISIL